MFKFIFISQDSTIDITSSVLSFSASSSILSPLLEANLIVVSSSFSHLSFFSPSFVFVSSDYLNFSSLFYVSYVSPFSTDDKFSYYSTLSISLVSIYEYLNSQIKLSFSFSGSLSSFISSYFSRLYSSIPSFLSKYFSPKPINITPSSENLLFNFKNKSFFNILLSYLPFCFSIPNSFDSYFFFEFFNSFYFVNILSFLSSTSYDWFYNSPNSKSNTSFLISSYSLSSLLPPFSYNNFSSHVFFLDPFTGKLSSFIFPPRSNPKFKFFFVSPLYDTSLSSSLKYNPNSFFLPLRSFLFKNILFSSKIIFSSQTPFSSFPVVSLHNLHFPNNYVNKYNPFIIHSWALSYSQNTLFFHYTASPNVSDLFNFFNSNLRLS